MIKPIIFLAVIGLLYGAYALLGGRVQNAFTGRAAETALAEGDLVRAAGLFAKVLESSPRDEKLRLKVCDLYRDAGNFSRAEFTLTSGLRDVGPSAALYKRLCALYVEQDKLYDAVDLLDSIRSPAARDAIEKERPAPPVFTPPGGHYTGRFEAALSVQDGLLIYVSWTGGIPSVTDGLYAQPVAVGPGITRVKAVAVDPGGLVSKWAETEYTMDSVVDPVTFADPALEAAIRRHIGRPDGLLYTSDLWGIIELNVPEEASYRTLDDLQYCPGLQTLVLTGDLNRCDISVLPRLTELTSLSLRAFGINSIDLEIIGLCEGLETLSLPENNIGPVKPLAALTRLTALDLSSNSILDISPLAALASLETLRVKQNAVQDLSPLSALAGLRELHAAQNILDSLRGIEKLTSLEILDCSFNANLSNISEVSGLTGLTRLSADHCRINALPDLSKLQALDELYLGSNQIAALSGIEGLINLSVLSAPENDITSLAPLGGVFGLIEIDVSHNGVSSVEPLRGLPSLVTVRVEYNRLSTMLPLKDCPSLKAFYAFGNTLTDPLNAWDGTGVSANRG
jgi:internalin A